ncbi:MAG: ABC transporter ATP-binding protein [Saprospiraceae bacterium]
MDDLSFRIGRGESVALVGESGSGKTLTGLALLGLLPAAARVIVKEIGWQDKQDGLRVNLAALPERERRKYRGGRIGMIFQDSRQALNPVRTCGSQLTEMLELHGKGNDKKSRRTLALEWLERARLSEPERIYRSYPHQLSGGQCQRVMIAQALCPEPELLIADEPTTALDVNIRAGILELLDELRRESGTGLLYISHDLDTVHRLAERCLLLYRGRMMESGLTSELFSQPETDYARALLVARPRLPDARKRLPVWNDPA